MQKPAETSVPIHDLIKRRWSPRAFAPTPVEPEKLVVLLEAARWAASSSNEQPWRLLVCDRYAPGELGAPAHAKLGDCLAAGNQAWALEAPVLILVSAVPTFARNGRANNHAWHDCGQAYANLALQATALDLFAHPMAGFDSAKAQAAFALPADWQPVIAVAVGYAGDISRLPEPRQAQEKAARTRKPLSEIVFQGAVGTPWSR